MRTSGASLCHAFGIRNVFLNNDVEAENFGLGHPEEKLYLTPRFSTSLLYSPALVEEQEKYLLEKEDHKRQIIKTILIFSDRMVKIYVYKWYTSLCICRHGALDKP